VEYYPFAGGRMTQTEVQARYDEVLASLAEGKSKTEDDIWDNVRLLHFMRPGMWEELQQYEPVHRPRFFWTRIWG
jgi:hypothetical protein